MKNLYCFVIVGLFITLGSSVASTKTTDKDFAEVIEKLMDVSFQSDSLGLVKITNELKRFTEKKELAYLAHYYIAFGKWQAVLRQLNLSAGAKDAIRLLHEAIAELETAVKLKGDFADAYILSLNCHFPLYYLDPDNRASLFPKAAALGQKALELAPQNPRMVLTDAQNIFYTPEQFGGSQEKGIARYKEAIKLFEKSSHVQKSLLPNWGHEIAYAWLGNAYLSLKQPDVPKAKESFEKALALRPDFAWVKDTMLPQIEE